MDEDKERGPGRKAKSDGRAEGAQTFRRGRALHFLERLELKRETLAAQLEENGFESIRPVIAGELKAVDGIIREFIQVFELHEKPEGCERGQGERRGRRGHGRGSRHGEQRESEQEGVHDSRQEAESGEMTKDESGLGQSKASDRGEAGN
ncbi:hypothetical protein [Saccharibacillus sacchari]|uniref:Uncharacterized protein n=1 Tax=Saccharibacillus sacchari DSM 19268 TaxID=915437 RepID=A0A010ZXB7_9BACL|nr:hypothetical protein [Saccharibacillus sacchari]EXG83274.1 hypothetical protein SacsacDRAFT_0239 [Saccharibacillus sacchari DSM 19268]